MDNVNTQAQRGKGTKAQSFFVRLADLYMFSFPFAPLCLPE